MRVRRVSVETFERMVRAQGPHCKFYKIPSTKGFSFPGLLMADGVWTYWPDNLTVEEEDKYIEMYGDLPDIFTPVEEKVAIRQVIRDRSKFESKDIQDSIDEDTKPR